MKVGEGIEGGVDGDIDDPSDRPVLLLRYYQLPLPLKAMPPTNNEQQKPETKTPHYGTSTQHQLICWCRMLLIMVQNVTNNGTGCYQCWCTDQHATAGLGLDVTSHSPSKISP